MLGLLPKHSEPCVLRLTRYFDCKEVVGVRSPPLQHFVTGIYSRAINKKAQDVTKLNWRPE